MYSHDQTDQVTNVVLPFYQFWQTQEAGRLANALVQGSMEDKVLVTMSSFWPELSIHASVGMPTCTA